MSTEYETRAEAGTKPDERVLFWLNELKLASGREKGWRKEAEEVVKIYEAEKRDQNSFNILFSNTETLLPALYNATPRPVVRRKQRRGTGPVHLLAAQVGTAIAEYALDTGDPEVESFDSAMQQAVLVAAVPGRAVVWYTVGDSCIHPETVLWKDFRHGYARRWEDVPWTARPHDMTREELVANFGDRLGNAVPVFAAEMEEDEEVKSGGRSAFDAENNKGSIKVARVWEIWDKETKVQLYLSPNYPDGILRETPDPYKLLGFFPHSEPLVLFSNVNSLKPRPLYNFYREQANELNRITIRINKIVGVMKVRGVYDSTVEEIGKVFELDDGEMAPAEGLAGLAGGSGQPALDKALWLMPIERLVAVLQQLYTQREQVKQVIYEITGLADILRGASKASETLGAQEIKERWGGLRIKRQQKRVQGFVRKNLRLIVELSLEMLPKDLLVEISSLRLPTAEQKQQAAMLQNQLVAAGQQMPPELAAVLSSPTQEEVFGLLKNDLLRSFHVDIETNSTVDVEATEDKQLITEFMTSVGQFLNGVGPLVQQGILPFEAAQAMLMAVSRRFRFGDEVEEHLQKMAPPKPQDNGDQAKLETARQQLKLEEQSLAQKLAADRAKLGLDKERQEVELTFRERQLALEERRFSMEQSRLDMERGAQSIEFLLRGAELDREDEQAKSGEAQGEEKAESAALAQAFTAVTKQLDTSSKELAELRGMVVALLEAAAQKNQPRKWTISRDGAGRPAAISEEEEGNATV
jgi:hypothetical protein